MAYRGSYLWRLRQAVGNDLVLMPGAMVALQRDDRRVLLTKRADDGTGPLRGLRSGTPFVPKKAEA